MDGQVNEADHTDEATPLMTGPSPSSPLCGEQARSREASGSLQGGQSTTWEPDGISLPLVMQSCPEPIPEGDD